MRCIILLIAIICSPVNTELLAQIIQAEGSIEIGDHTGNVTPGTIKWNGTDFQGWDGQKWISMSGPVFRTVEDIDGNLYRTVVIGDQEWMAQNLRTTKYNDGSTIFPVGSQLQWDSAVSLGVGAYCSYNFDDFHLPQFGYLYNGFVINDSFNVCPEGWHVPSREEYGMLADYMATKTEYEGGNLKSIGVWEFNAGLWKSPNVNATDSFGFNGIPGGYFSTLKTFTGLHELSIYWTSSFFTDSNIFVAILSFENGALQRDLQFKNDVGMSIRCVKD